MKTSALPALCSFIAVAVPSSAFAAESLDLDAPATRMVVSAQGPGSGVHALGARFGLPLPQLDIHYVYGFSDRFVFELETSIPVIPAGFARIYVGARAKLIEVGPLALALRAGAMTAIGFTPDEKWLFAAVQGGAVLTVGSETQRLSLGLDVPYGYEEDVGKGITRIEPMAAYEVAAVDGANFAVHVRGWMAKDGDTFLFIPFVGIGGSI